MKKILFVEDNTLIARIYSQKLLDAGYEVVVAQDGLEAIKLLPEFKPDVVVLDLLMPRLTGADVLKFLRGHAELKTTRVIVFSNSFLSDLVQPIAAHDVQRTLVKAAVNPARLLEVIRQVMEEPAHVSVISKKSAAATPAEPTPPEPTVVAAKKPEPARPAGGLDQEFFARMGKQFHERMPPLFKELRQLCRDFIEAGSSQNQATQLEALNRKLGFLTQISGMAGYRRTAELSSALEALIFELLTKPAAINDCSRQTIAASIALLADHFEHFKPVDEPDISQPTILVVDDDAVSNRALVQSLGRAKLSATSTIDPLNALKKLGQNSYSAVLMDINMPDMDGLALCEQMRTIPRHKRTPVIFVTSQTDFKTRARTVLSGGNDIIAKPISPTEVCVKVLSQLLKTS